MKTITKKCQIIKHTERKAEKNTKNGRKSKKKLILIHKKSGRHKSLSLNHFYKRLKK